MISQAQGPFDKSDISKEISAGLASPNISNVHVEESIDLLPTHTEIWIESTEWNTSGEETPSVNNGDEKLSQTNNDADINISIHANNDVDICWN